MTMLSGNFGAPSFADLQCNGMRQGDHFLLAMRSFEEQLSTNMNEFCFPINDLRALAQEVRMNIRNL